MRNPSRTAVFEQPVFVHMAALAAFLVAAHPSMPLQAQGLQSEKAIETIVDAPVATEEKTVAEEQGRIAAAIENSGENAAEIRKRISIDKLDIVFVPELAGDSSPLGKAIEDNDEAIKELRIALEGSAMFYHAIDSRSVLLRDIVAVEFGEGNDVTVFAASADPEN